MDNEKKIHSEYIRILKNIGPEARLKRAIELSDLTRDLYLTGLRSRYPQASEKEIAELYIEKVSKCHNTDY